MVIMGRSFPYSTLYSVVTKPGPNKAASNREVLLHFVQDPDPAFTARELAEEFDKTRQWADKTLKELERESYVKSKNPGGGAKFYWVTEAGKEFLRDTRPNP